MLPSVDEIEKRRKNLGLSQKQLSKLSGVSQSMIAKIETGRINPSYSKTKAIFDTLQNLQRKMETKAKDILQENVVGIQKSEPVSRATKTMHETGFSQLPVLDGTQPVGSISERTVLDRILKGHDLSELSRLRVEEIMEEAFPSIDPETPLDVVSSLLQYSSAVLVTKKGEISGIITKADLLKIIHS